MRPSREFLLDSFIHGFGHWILDGWLLKIVWNAFIPAIFGFASLLYWNAVGILFLIALVRPPHTSMFRANWVREQNAKKDLEDMDSDWLEDND